jgi:hypothetical protein
MIWDGMDVTGVSDQSDSYRELSYPIDMAGLAIHGMAIESFQSGRML